MAGWLDSMNWPPYPGPAPLLDGDVHIVGWAPGAGSERMAEWRATLAADEVERASRFRFARHRLAWEAARGGLREVLGGYVGKAPAELEFAVATDGKPSLVGGRGLRFNLSHTDDLVVLAMTRGGELGVDVEARRSVPERAAIAQTHFTATERALLAAAERDGDGERCFLRLWTRKEALIKAVGIGLGYPLPRVDVSWAAGSGGPVFQPDAPGASGAWTLDDLDVGPDHQGALACRFFVGEIRSFRLG
ncbi:MAG: 4'-phosphopantetheinyl transferase superfamily protein [Myxococcota bacterium]